MLPYAFGMAVLAICFRFAVLVQLSRSIKHLQNQAPPKGVELGDDEFILHVEGTASSQRVVRHIGGTSWPGLFIWRSFLIHIINLYRTEIATFLLTNSLI